jgi:UDP-N-acetyl-D-galactosamine dehydrogenase
MANNIKIGIIGLGYVGLPLSIAFARKYPVVAYDIDKTRVAALNQGLDISRETPTETIQNALKRGLKITDNKKHLATANIYIITVPTPVTKENKPDLRALKAASKLLAQYLKQEDIIIYESTVYPGATEEICAPILEQFSSLKYNVDFYVGYSPERISPGDAAHRLENSIKITSGSTPQTAQKVDDLYQTIIEAGTYLAPSIAVAEAAKVIENTQRDINIAFVNELAQLFSLMNLDTQEVLKAAGTKWNFLPFKPGLVVGIV